VSLGAGTLFPQWNQARIENLIHLRVIDNFAAEVDHLNR
jgi:hypothetical protein